MSIIIKGLLLLFALCAAAILWFWTPDMPREKLRALYLGAPEEMMDVAGVRLHVTDGGPREAPALIMIHGTGSHLQTWDGWAEALEPEFRVIRLDLPGSGLSYPDPSGDYTDTRSMEILLALMDALDVEMAGLIGNSLGGRIAWKFAAEHPERVSELVLISPDGFASPGFAYGKPADVPFIMTAMKYILPRSMLRSNLAIAYGDETRLTDETLTRYHDLMRAPGGRTALLERMRQTVLEDPEPVLQTITAPTLLLWGKDDGMIPVASAADYERVMPNATLVRLPGLGHVPHEELPEVSIAPVRSFLMGD